MLGITIRHEPAAARVRRILGLLPLAMVAAGLYLGGLQGLVACTAGAVFVLATDAIRFARTPPAARPPIIAFPRMPGMLVVVAIFSLPILLPTFTGHRLGWLLFILAVLVVAWVIGGVLTVVLRTLASFAVRRPA